MFITYYEEIDYKKTKNNLDFQIEKYKCYLLAIYNCEIPELVNDKIVLKHNNHEKYPFVGHITNCINSLNEKDRIMIIQIYFLNLKTDIIANKIGYNRNYFYEKRKISVVKLAFSLNIEVMKIDVKN